MFLSLFWLEDCKSKHPPRNSMEVEYQIKLFSVFPSSNSKINLRNMLQNKQGFEIFEIF